MKQNDQSEKAVSNKNTQIAKQNGKMRIIQRMEMPTKEGMNPLYWSNIFSFNTLGCSTLSPINPQKICEYQIDKSLKAVAVMNIESLAIIVTYNTFEGQEQVFALNGRDNDFSKQAKGWILRGNSDNPVTEEGVCQFLSNPKDSPNAFELKGNISIKLENGYIQKMSFVDVATKVDIPRDDSCLHSWIDSAKNELTVSSQQLEKDPDNERLRWSVQEAKEDLSRYQQRLLKPQPKGPATLSNGHIVVKWVSKKHKYSIFDNLP